MTQNGAVNTSGPITTATALEQTNYTTVGAPPRGNTKVSTRVNEANLTSEIIVMLKENTFESIDEFAI